MSMAGREAEACPIGASWIPPYIIRWACPERIVHRPLPIVLEPSELRLVRLDEGPTFAKS